MLKRLASGPMHALQTRKGSKGMNDAAGIVSDANTSHADSGRKANYSGVRVFTEELRATLRIGRQSTQALSRDCIAS